MIIARFLLLFSLLVSCLRSLCAILAKTKSIVFWEKRKKGIIFAEENEFRHNGDY